MEWIIIFALVMLYISLSEKIEKVTKILNKRKRIDWEEKGLSKVIQGLVNSKCKIDTDEALTLVGKAEIEGMVLDSDEEWIKLEYLDKNNGKKIAVFRIDSIDTILVIE